MKEEIQRCGKCNRKLVWPVTEDQREIRFVDTLNGYRCVDCYRTEPRTCVLCKGPVAPSSYVKINRSNGYEEFVCESCAVITPSAACSACRRPLTDVMTTIAGSLYCFDCGARQLQKAVENKKVKLPQPTFLLSKEIGALVYAPPTLPESAEVPDKYRDAIAKMEALKVIAEAEAERRRLGKWDMGQWPTLEMETIQPPTNTLVEKFGGLPSGPVGSDYAATGPGPLNGGPYASIATGATGLTGRGVMGPTAVSGELYYSKLDRTIKVRSVLAATPPAAPVEPEPQDFNRPISFED